jgi:hypothetical protein
VFISTFPHLSRNDSIGLPSLPSLLPNEGMIPAHSNTGNLLINQLNDCASSVPSSSSASQTPSFKQVRRYLRTVEQREALGQFIAAGWTPAELAEYARGMYLASGQSKPTAVSYRFVITMGANHERAKEALATMRAPGFIMPPLDRPVPKHYEWDDHDNPAHPDGVRGAVETLARGYMNAYDDKLKRPRRGPDTPIRKGLLKKCFRDLYAADAFGLRSGVRR